MKLVIPDWTPPRLNEVIGRHWRKASRLKTDMVLLLTVYSRQQFVPAAKGRRSVELIVSLGKGQKQPDADAYDKLLLDALVRTGLLIDDAARGLAGRVKVTFRRGDEGRRQTVIVLKDE